MNIGDLDIMVTEILRRAEEATFALHGPAETEFGWGWEPTISFWSDSRRVHFYYGMGTYTQGVTVEVAEIQYDRETIKANSKVALTIVKAMDEAWDIIECFLRRKCAFKDLPKHEWKSEVPNHDKFIPHPPDRANPANIIGIIKNPNAKPWKGKQ